MVLFHRARRCSGVAIHQPSPLLERSAQRKLLGTHIGHVANADEAAIWIVALKDAAALIKNRAVVEDESQRVCAVEIERHDVAAIVERRITPLDLLADALVRCKNDLANRLCLLLERMSERCHEIIHAQELGGGRLCHFVQDDHAPHDSVNMAWSGQDDGLRQHPPTWDNMTKMKHSWGALEASWSSKIGDVLGSERLQSLADFLQREEREGKLICPPASERLAAFSYTPYPKTRVVILGQDPYHGPAQAHGLSFSVPRGVRVPPSLKNIFKEIHRDLGVAIPEHGCLSSWAEQGVLLLNTVLTVRAGEAGSHQGQGWEAFTDAAIAALDRKRDGVVFMLWGAHAQKKAALIDENRHCVLRSVHPSPLSAHRGFLGCGHFSAANAYLLECGQAPIDWSLPD